MNKMEKKQGEYGVLTRVAGTEYFEGGYEWFSDAIEAMVDKWEQLTVRERALIRGYGYCNEFGRDYMVAVGFYNEETGEALESMTLAEVVE